MVDSLTPDQQDSLKYTATITPTTSGFVVISVPCRSRSEDAATNLNTASESHTVSVNLVRPSVVISDVPTTSQNSDFDITIMFSESVTGFQSSDISLTGTATAAATVTGFQWEWEWYYIYGKHNADRFGGSDDPCASECCPR